MTDDEFESEFFTKLGWCACGRPDEFLNWLADILSLLKGRETAFVNGREFDQEDFDKSFSTLMQGDGAKYFVFYWLQGLILTDHGVGVIGSWLSGPGDDLLTELGVRGYGCHGREDEERDSKGT